MKKPFKVIATGFLALSIGFSAITAVSAAGQVSSSAVVALDNIANAAPGEKVTITGSSDLQEVLIKVFAPDLTIMYFDVVAVINGKYTASFKLPTSAAAGQYQAVAGSGANVTSVAFTVAVSKPPVNNPDPETGTPETGPVAPTPAPETPEETEPVAPAPTPTPGKPDTGTNVPTNTVVFTSSDIPKPQNGLVTLNVSFGAGQAGGTVDLPANLAEITDTDVQLVLKDSSITLPKEVLASLAQLVPASEKVADSSIVLHVKELSASDLNEAVSTLSNSAAGVTAQVGGQALDLGLAVKGKNGTETKLEQFTKPVTISLKAAEESKELAGIYYISSNNQASYVGGKWQGDMLTVPVTHFSSYAVLTYDKSFADLQDNHWAYQAVHALSAKHIIEGVSATSFAPAKSLTRAEFVTMLARYLNLAPAEVAPFKDVAAGSWYADAVSSAYASGLVTGVSEDSFAPNKNITREELAVLLARAQGLTKASATSSFTDSNSISSWAQDAVDSVVKEGLMVGLPQNKFAPKAQATRAEAAKVIYTLDQLK